MRALFALSLGLLLATSASAQAGRTVQVTGTVVDAADGQPLPGATVLMVRMSADSTQVGAASAADGTFRLAVAAGAYELRVSFVGYTSLARPVTASGSALALGAVELAEDAALLEGVDVAATRQRVEVRGDTTAFSADAFPVNPDATAEDLVAKLPGVTVENGTVTAEGETVRRVLIDGREFFGTDVQAALNTLPAEMIKEVQVFDRQSEESRFSGFDDGDAEKTLNIVTRAGTQNSQFGRVYAGAGPEGEYLAGGNTTILKGDRRITVVGLANNVDQQNFAAEDLAGIASGGGGRGRRGGRGGGDVGGLLQNEQDGIASANALGVSYSDVLAGGKLRLTGSTFFNTSETLLDAGLTRSTLTDGGISQLYDETDTADTDNANARATLRAQYDLSDRTQLTFEPQFSLQDVGAISDLRGITRSPDGAALALTTSETDASAFALSSEIELGVRHRFAARGRTLSLSVEGAVGDQNGETTQATQTVNAADGSMAFASDQLFDTASDSRSLQARLSFTEPLSETTQLQFSYRPELSRSSSDQGAFLADASGAYTVPDASFTSAFEQQSFVQRGGVSLRTGSREANGQIGFDLQHERLEGEQLAPEAFTVDRSFWSFLPSARARITLSEGKRLDLNYRASTRTPSANQLSSLVDNSNPLLLTTGNPDLDPSTTHSLRARFNSTDAAGGSVLFGFISGSYGQNYIGSSTILAREPVTTPSGVVVPAGGQLTQPENVDGYWNGRALVSYGRPIGLIKSNANMSFGGSYTRAPGLVNNALNVSDQFGLDGRVFIGSAISERVDFSLEYGARYSATTNSDAPSLDDTTVRHLAGAKLAWLPWGGLSLGTNLNALYYTGLDDSIDPSQILWSAKAGYKFLPGDVAEVSLSVYDILSQQQDVERTVTELYIQDARTEALGRYVMLNLTYRLSNFGQGNARSDDDERGGRGDRGGFGGRGE
ncbi:outer membrane beta-barrel protein [Rubricoccus marinus]|uniref:Outer membrane protein beta-barrel domain-containing protein n=1 Tax=Rubricoccus marinus TaxID=716817 RepID=A0A259U1D5_9BACT|nr:outer membrane beta-barrel protein [Rubricoccus marinus]OZC03843.1 hypothetical protein BSZ36_13115 [Rubricoccus marinus]